MNFFKKFKNYVAKESVNIQQGQKVQKPIQKQSSQSYSDVLKEFTQSSISSDTFEYIISDILNSNDQIDTYEQLRMSQGKQQQQIQNMYLKDFIFVNKATQGRQITIQQWNQMIEKEDLSLQPKKNIYFSIFKGIDFTVRKKAWDLLANVPQMKKRYHLTYKKISNPKLIGQKQLDQIDKDVPRSKGVTKFTNELRNILIAYTKLSEKPYVQGMNIIVGCLLQVLSLQNDRQLEQFEIMQNQFEERVFWVFVGIMKWKKWEEMFQTNMLGLFKKLKVLQQLMSKHVEKVYKKLLSYQWDLTIFSQYYLTLMIYNNPKNFSKIILDLFLLDGENVLHSLIIRIMKMQQQKILGFEDEGELMMYLKSGILKDCLATMQKQQVTATKLEDFDLNFVQIKKF